MAWISWVGGCRRTWQNVFLQPQSAECVLTKLGKPNWINIQD